jgi:diguanylate cyclase (GGDEF)-like protein
LPVAADLSARSRFTEDLAKREKAMSLLATTDSLTGLMSRSAFEAHVDQALHEGGNAFVMVAIDLDHFKRINDTWGHEAGDRALVHAAQIFQAQIRSGDAAGRLGGDEFLLFLKDASIAEAEAICGRIRATLRQTALAMDTKTDIMLSLSCGIAGSSDADSFQDIYREADKALYMAKFAGRNTVRSIA